MPFDKKALLDKAAKEVMGAGDAALRKRLEAKQSKANAVPDEAGESETCDQCGASVAEGATSCEKCGAPLKTGDAEEAAEGEMSEADLGELAAARSKMLQE